MKIRFSVVSMRLWFSFLLPVVVSGCIVHLGGISEDELRDLFHLRGLGKDSQSVLSFETVPSAEFAVYRSDSITGIRKQLLVKPSGTSWPPKSATKDVQMLNSHLEALQPSGIFVDGCPVDDRSYNQHPYPRPYEGILPNNDDPNAYPSNKYEIKDNTCVVAGRPTATLYNDNVYYYVVAIRGKETAGKEGSGTFFYSDIVAVTPAPGDSPDHVNALNGGLIGLQGIYSDVSGPFLLSNNSRDKFPIIDKQDGLVEYNLFYSSASRLKGCDYVHHETCDVLNKDGNRVTLGRRAFYDLVHSGGLFTKPTDIYLTYHSDMVLRENNKKLYGVYVPDDNHLNATLPVYATLEVINSFGSNLDRDDERGRAEVEIKQFDDVEVKAGDASITVALKGVPMLSTWTSNATRAIMLTPRPNGYSISYVEDTPSSNRDVQKLFISTEATTVSGLGGSDVILTPYKLTQGIQNGKRYLVQVQAEYDLSTLANGNQGFTSESIKRISYVYVAVPHVNYTNVEWRSAYNVWKEADLTAVDNERGQKLTVYASPSYITATSQGIKTDYDIYQSDNRTCAASPKDALVCDGLALKVQSGSRLHSNASFSNGKLPYISSSFPGTLVDNTSEFSSAGITRSGSLVISDVVETGRFFLANSPGSSATIDPTPVFTIKLPEQLVFGTHHTNPRYVLLIWGRSKPV